jgi:hypothetical protein
LVTGFAEFDMRKSARAVMAILAALMAATIPIFAHVASAAERGGARVNRAVAFVGYGTRVIPKLPFEVGRLSADRDDLVFVHHSPQPAKVLLAPSDGGMGMKLGPGTSEPEDVFAEIDEVTKTPGWRVETASYSIPMLPALSAWSTKDGTKWAVEFTIEGSKDKDEIVYLEGPFAKGDAPKLDSLVAKNMTVSTRTSDSVEVTYLVGDAPWRQLRQLVPLSPDAFMLITVQAPSPRAAQVFGLSRQLAVDMKARPR